MKLKIKIEAPDTLNGIAEGVACLGKDGEITWRSGQNVFYTINRGFPKLSANTPERTVVREILGAISVHWEKD